MKNKNNALLALTAAASALPGVNAAQISDEFQIGYRYYAYDEEPLDPDNVIGPITDRYDIDVNQFNLIAPLSETMELSVDYQHEKMSGASPWYTIMGPDGKPLQVMSGASIEDTRQDAAMSLTSLHGRHSFVATAAVSKEDDYDSTSFALEYNLETEDKLGTYTLAWDVSNDDIFPVDADIYPTRPQTEQSKHSNSALFAYSHIINKQTLVKFSAGYSRKTGYLSDPYKVVFVDFRLIGDTRPETRYSRTAALQARYFSDSLNGAFHADYRFYDDSWDIQSHTFEFAWYQNIGWGIQLVPSLRLYSQNEAFFYEVFYEQTREDGYYSTDYRLSEYGAITYGLSLNKAFENWSLTVSAERYESGGDKVFADADVENPALLDFTLIAAGFNFRF